MSVSLTKGQTVEFTKENPGLSHVVAGAGWDGKTDAPIDLDLMIVQVGEDGKALTDANGNNSNADEALLFFNNKDLPGLHHTGDNLTGEGDGDDEQIEVKLSEVASNVKELRVILVSYSGETFDQVANAFVRLFNKDNNQELAKYEVSSGYDGKRGIELGRLVRNGSEWDFKATGEVVEGSNFKNMLTTLGIS
jgi:tellurium resistance protein TerD